MVFDLSIRMPVISGWVERKRRDFQVPTGQGRGEGRRRRIEIPGGERQNRLRAVGEIFQNVGRKGTRPTHRRAARGCLGQ